jgi:putative membrane protein
LSSIAPVTLRTTHIRCHPAAVVFLLGARCPLRARRGVSETPIERIVDVTAWHPTSVADEGSENKTPAQAPGQTTGDIAGKAPGEPDPRLLYANERTFLSWIRTSLALVAAGLAIIELLPAFRIAGGRRVVGLPLIALGAWLALTAYRTWTANERAMREGRPLPRSHQALIVAGGVGVVAFVALVLAALNK